MPTTDNNKKTSSRPAASSNGKKPASRPTNPASNTKIGSKPAIPIKKKKRRKKKSYGSLKFAFAMLIIAVAAYLALCALDTAGIIDIGELNLLGGGKDMGEAIPVPEDDEAIFHFIDVGQGDAILITTSGGNVLVDTSESSEWDKLNAYLERANIEKIDYLVLTHPDADHIGNADKVILNYEIGKVIMTDYAATSKTFERMLDAIEEKDLDVIMPKPGDSFALGALKLTVVAPTKEFDDPNEMSIVLKATFGETSVMLTGDAEKESEGDLLSYWNKDDLKCDILKVGHHGSSSSTTDDFLAAVDPSIAVISCGEDNKYGHPHDEIRDKLAKEKITVYRTDLHGSIVFRTDGERFELVSTEK